jgi:hypothetical protein
MDRKCFHAFLNAMGFTGPLLLMVLELVSALEVGVKLGDEPGALNDVVDSKVGDGIIPGGNLNFLKSSVTGAD